MTDSLLKHILIAYDTPDDKRRRKLVRISKDYACRIQKSVFQGWVSEQQLKELESLFFQHIVPDEDSILLMPACQRCCEQIRIVGCGEIRKAEPFFLI